MTNSLSTTQPGAVSKFIAEVGADFTRAWTLMVALGAAHGEVDAVPHPGYWTTFLILLGIGAVAGAARKTEWPDE